MIREFFFCMIRMGIAGPEYKSGVAQFRVDPETTGATILEDFRQGIARHTGHADFIVTSFNEILSVQKPVDKPANGTDIITG